MSWEPEVEELESRRERARRLGGSEGVARQHAEGKLTVRERIELLSDPGSFREFMGLMGSATYDDLGRLADFMPKGSVSGFCQVNGRQVVVTGGDFTVRGGAGGGSGSAGIGMELSAANRALEWRVPYVRLLDAAGGSILPFAAMGRTYLPDGLWATAVEVQLLRTVPVVSAALGAAAGINSVNLCLSHFSVMLKDKSQAFPGGPPVVRTALAIEITKEELGGSYLHTHVSGVADNLADSEEEALGLVRRFLSYLPQNVWEAPSRETCDDPVGRREEGLLSIIPKGRRRPYSAKALIEAVADKGSFFEIAPFYGRSRITGLARFNGYPVGVAANDIAHVGGATDVAAAAKVVRLLHLCDTFHLPFISFSDDPGMMVGPDAEREGIERAAADLTITVCDSQMPWATVVVGQCFGVSGMCQHRPTGMFRRYAWPSASWGSMHIEGGTAAAFRREIANAADPEAKLRELEAHLQAVKSPFRTAEATGQDIIDPRDTRELLCEFVEQAQPILRTQLGRTSMPYRRP